MVSIGMADVRAGRARDGFGVWERRREARADSRWMVMVCPLDGDGKK
jgi:hypothetical protein